MEYHIDINELNLKDTELRLGLPGTEEHKQELQEEEDVSCVTSNKRQFHEINNHNVKEEESSLPTKTQIIGWPPVRSNRKNNNNMNESYVKVSMDGAPYLRKIDLKIYKNYHEILKALESMFKFNNNNIGEGYKRCGFVMTYQDKDGDWMLVGDVPWDMFTSSCQKLRIMKKSEAPMK